MFNFLFAEPYEDRKVDNTILKGGTVIDTCSVNDGHLPFETGIQSSKYNNGDWVIVEAYGTKEDAKDGHDKWVKIMSTIPLPEKLVDCSNSYIQSISDSEEFYFEGE